MIFSPVVTKNYEWLNTVNGDDYNLFRDLNGTVQKATWEPIVVRSVRADRLQKQLKSDFPWLGGVLFFRKQAVDLLHDMLEANGEILPVILEGTKDELFVHNTRWLYNALDEEKSTIERFKDSGRIMWIKKVVFHENVVCGVDIFRLPMRSSETYVSEKFVEQVTKHGLKGLEFKPV